MFSSKVGILLGRDNVLRTERRRWGLALAGFVAFVGIATAWTLRDRPIDYVQRDGAVLDVLNATLQSACDLADGLFLVQAASHPPSGRELLLKTGLSATGSARACVAGQLQALESSGLSAQPAEMDSHYALILYRPGDEAYTEQAVDAIAGFVAGADPAERIGLYLWRTALEPLADFGANRDQLLAAVRRLPDYDQSATSMAPSHVQREAARLVATVAPGLVTTRTVIGVVPDEIVSSETGAGADADFYWAAFPRRAGEGAAPLRRAIAQNQRQRYFRVGYCLGDVDWSDLAAIQTAQDTCGADTIAAGSIRGQRRISFHLEPEANFIFEARSALSELGDRKALNRAKRAFPVKMSLDDESTLLDIELNIRGAGTLRCARKSFGVSSSAALKLFPDAQVDRFILLSLCKDRTLINTHLGASIYRAFGLFPFRFRFVEVAINGTSNGIYLLLEHPTTEIERSASTVGFMRRAYDWEPKGMREGGNAALKQYKRLLEEFVEGSVEHAERLGVGQYLQWLALNSAVSNGDYVDELWVHGTAAIEPSGPAESYSIFAWDFDALFTLCHSGEAVIQDPYDLLYCAESDFDHRILREPAYYQYFVEQLAATLSQLDEAAFRGYLDNTLSSIRPFLSNEEMITRTFTLDERPIEADLEVAAQLQRVSDRLEREYAQRRASLLSNIAKYRQGGAAAQVQVHN